MKKLKQFLYKYFVEWNNYTKIVLILIFLNFFIYFFIGLIIIYILKSYLIIICYCFKDWFFFWNNWKLWIDWECIDTRYFLEFIDDCIKDPIKIKKLIFYILILFLLFCKETIVFLYCQFEYWKINFFILELKYQLIHLIFIDINLGQFFLTVDQYEVFYNYVKFILCIIIKIKLS